jgi:hypothetical protein
LTEVLSDMASGLYDIAKEGFLGGTLGWNSGVVKAQLVGTGYTANFSTHEDLADISAKIAPPIEVQVRTITDGVADAQDLVFESLSPGQVVAACVIYLDTGTAATSTLIAYIDDLDVTTTGGDLTVEWDSGANKIWSF